MGLIVRSEVGVIQSGEGCESVLRNPGRSPASAGGPMAALCEARQKILEGAPEYRANEGGGGTVYVTVG